MKRAMLIIALCIPFYGCSEKTRVIELNAHHCSMDSSKYRAEFILNCVSSANPKSDEEPEDWIQICQQMAEETLCPEVTMLISQRHCNGPGCGWIETHREPKKK